jgi:alpha-galactosidase
MLEVGNGGMSVEEYRSHMALWALLAAPLLTGNDVRNMTPETRSILTNREVIGIDQDPLGRQAQRTRHDQTTEVWIKPLADGSSAVGLFNRSSMPTSLTVVWSELGLGTNPMLRNVWSGVDLGRQGSTFSAKIPVHGVILLKATH